MLLRSYICNLNNYYGVYNVIIDNLYLTKDMANRLNPCFSYKKLHFIETFKISLIEKSDLKIACDNASKYCS